jgi:hypothetical protein
MRHLLRQIGAGQSGGNLSQAMTGARITQLTALTLLTPRAVPSKLL